MLSSSSTSTRTGVLVNLVGVALVVLGLFLPMFMQSNPQLPGSIHPLYEWQAVLVDTLNIGLTVLLVAGAALPLLGVLILAATSIATLLGVQMPQLSTLKRVVAIVGLVLQLLFEVITLLIFLIGYARTDISWGFVLMPVGFIVAVVGTFL